MVEVFYGKNSYALRQAVNQRLEQFIAKYGNLNIERIDAEFVEYQQIVNSVEGYNLLADAKLVILDHPSRNNQFVANFQAILDRLPESNQLLIIESRLDERSSYYKDLNNIKKFHQFTEMQSASLPNWVIDQTKSYGGQISLTDARYLIERIGADQMMLNNEIRKLISYNSNINIQSIDLLTEATPQSTIFSLIDHILAGRLTEALKLYDDQRAQNVETTAITGMLAWQLHILAILQYSADLSDKQIAANNQLNPFVVSKSRAVSKKISRHQLKKIVSLALDCDFQSKTKSVDSDQLMRQLIIDIYQIVTAQEASINI